MEFYGSLDEDKKRKYELISEKSIQITSYTYKYIINLSCERRDIPAKEKLIASWPN